MITETVKPFTPMAKLTEPTLRLRGSGEDISHVNVMVYSRGGAGTLLTSIKSPMPWVLHGMQHGGDEYLSPLSDERDMCLVWWAIGATNTKGECA